MIYFCRFSPVFCLIFEKKDLSEHFRCKLKFFRYAEGTVISAETVNSPRECIILHINNESLYIKTHKGYGYTAVYSPLPPHCFEKCNICVE